MADESGLSVPYGCDIDHTGVELSPEAVVGDHSRCEFVCPQCGQQLTKKLKGEQRRPHFAHYMDATDRNCPWRDDEGVQQAYTRSQAQALEAARNIRLFLQRRPHTRDLALFGSIPPLSSDDIAKVTRGKLDGALRVDGTGTKNRLEILDLLPDGRAGWIELDPDSPRFRIDIRPAELVNGGSWVSPGLEPGITFLGNAEWGRLVASPRRISSGQNLYYVVAPGDAAKLRYDEKYRLGRYEVICLLADQGHLNALRSVAPDVHLDFESLQVDVVSPLSVPPSDITVGRVRVPKGREVLLSVVLPKNKDRPLEVFPIPFSGAGQVAIPAFGLGVPRFLRLNLEGTSSQRILVHWPFEAERDWILDFISVEHAPVSDISAVDPVIGLSMDDGPLLNPLFYPKVTIQAKYDERGSPLLPKVSLVGPLGFTVTLRGEFPGEDEKPVWLEERERADVGTVNARLKDIFSRGCRALEIGFGTLGHATIVATGFFEATVARQADQRREESQRVEVLAREERARQEELEKIRKAEERRIWRERMQERIRQSLRERQEPAPRHISERFVIALLGLPAEAPRDELRSLRSLVRRVRRELRSKNRAGDQEIGE